MASDKEATVIKKYANRRLYHTGTSSYVTLEDLAGLVRNGEDFVVYDAKSGEDITRSVLAQIIFEEESKDGQNLLPIAFLRQLIRFYGDSMQNLVPTYLDFSIDSLTRDSDKLRGQMANAFGPSAFTAIEETVRRNTEMFEQAMRMFLPFSGGRPEPTTQDRPRTEPKVETRSEGKADGEFDTLKRQLEEMQKKIDALAGKS